LWDHAFSYNSFSKPLICGDYLVITSGNAYANDGSNFGRGYIYAVNKNDGSIKNFLLAGGNVWGNPVSYDAKIYVGSDDHHLYALDSTKFLSNNVNIEETGYDAVKLMSIFPRPFFEEVMIVYEVNFDSKITIKIYDYYGDEVKFLYKGKRKKGEYTIKWDGVDNNDKEIPQGAYFVDIGSGDYYKSGIILKQ